MFVRCLSVLAVGSVLVLAGCSGGGGDGSSDGKSASPQSSASPSGPVYTKFEDFDGDELMFVETGMPVGMRMKTVDAAWATEFAGSTAEAGSHYLVVYVVVTGELDDRGVADAKLHQLYLGLRSGASAEDCADPTEQPETGFCMGNAWVTSKLERVADDEWRDHAWQDGQYASVAMSTGETLSGAVAFKVPDSTEITGDTLFCATDRDETVMAYGNCVAIPKLDPRS